MEIGQKSLNFGKNDRVDTFFCPYRIGRVSLYKGEKPCQSCQNEKGNRGIK